MSARNTNQAIQDEFEYSTISVDRVVKVIKGGRRFSFVALVIAGNKKGLVGFGKGKCNEYSASVEKAKKASRKNMFKIPIINNTIPHEVHGKYNGSKIVFLPACSGTGLKVGSVARVICELAGIENIMSKYFRRKSNHNNLRVAVDALKKLRDPLSIAKDRGVDLKKVFNG